VKIQDALILAAATTIVAFGSALAADKAVPGTVPSAVANPQAQVIPDISALQAVDLAWAKYFNRGDANAVAVLYDENAVLLPPNAPAVVGRNAIRAFLGHMMNEARKAGVTFNIGPKPAGGVSGDMGWQSGTYAVKDKSGNVVETGKSLSVSRKQGRKWFYVRDTWNVDAAPSAPASAPAPAPPAPSTEPKK
jgi:ketosteroid isomerase-like protein